MILRKGKTKNTLESSINSALLAVEIYNKPRSPFRVESYITLMIMAWTKLFHAYFHYISGDRFYYKEKNGRYKKIDGEKKAWELKTCITKYGKLKEPVKQNLIFFIKLRNRIEHRHINSEDINLSIFGECQSLLYNFENELISLFGEEYAINENLAFALQFSRIRDVKQMEASKTLLSKELRNINEFIRKYRDSLSDDVFNAQEFSIKLIVIPKISNTNKSDLAIHFVDYNSLTEEQKSHYEKLDVLIKEKVVPKECINAERYKPMQVVNSITKTINIDFNIYDHKSLLYIFSIRPTQKDNKDAFNTNTKYCHYDQAHNDYLYKKEWIDFIIHIITKNKLTKDQWRHYFKTNKKIDITEYV